MGFVTVLLILIAVSTCDPKHANSENPKENHESNHGNDTVKHEEQNAAKAHEVETLVDTTVVRATLDSLVKGPEITPKAGH